MIEEKKYKEEKKYNNNKTLLDHFIYTYDSEGNITKKIGYDLDGDFFNEKKIFKYEYYD